jgi:hypothetical protein
MIELQFYRCDACHGIVSLWDIKQLGRCRCGQNKIRPTNLTLIEKIVQIVRHPKVWRWGDGEYLNGK